MKNRRKLKLVKCLVKDKGSDQDGKIVHRCCVCGRYGVWDENWSWYGSLRDLDDGKKLDKLCSAECRAKYKKHGRLVWKTVEKKQVSEESRCSKHKYTKTPDVHPNHFLTKQN